MSDLGPQPDPFEKLSDEDIQTRIASAEKFLLGSALERLASGESTMEELVIEGHSVEERIRREHFYNPEDWE